MVSVPPRPPPSSGQRRLTRQLRVNLAGDLLALTLLLPTWFVYSSPWEAALWIARGCVAVAIVIALYLARSPDPTRAVLTVVAAHVFASLVATAILPEFGPITTLIVVGDLQFWIEHLGSSHRRVVQQLAAGVVGALSVLSLQRWTGLGTDAPRWLLLLFVVGQGCGVGLMVARSNWSMMTRCRQQRDELLASIARLQIVADEARRALSTRIAAGPGRRIRELAEALASLRRRPAEAEAVGRDDIDRMLQLASSAASELRVVAHGLHSNDLRTQGLAAVIGTIDWGSEPPAPVFAGQPSSSDASQQALFVPRHWQTIRPSMIDQEITSSEDSPTSM